MSVVNVAELMSDPDFARTIILRRPAPARFANEGEPIPSYEDDVAITAIVQPAKAEDILALAEGDRGSGAGIRVWSETTLQMATGEDDPNGRDADILVVDSKTYRVVGEQTWDAHGYRFVLATEYLGS